MRYALFPIFLLTISCSHYRADPPPLPPVVFAPVLPPTITPIQVIFEHQPVNPGAECVVEDGYTLQELTTCANNRGMQGWIVGLYATNEGGHEVIRVVGKVNDAGWILLHEYEHHVENALRDDPDAVRKARHAFRQLMTKDFEQGTEDLLKEIP